MPAHPETLGDICCEQSTWSSSTSSPHGGTHRESPPPHPLPQRKLSIPVATASHGHLGGGGENLPFPVMWWEVSLSSTQEGCHGCEAPPWISVIGAPRPQGAGPTHRLQQICSEEVVTWSPVDEDVSPPMRSWFCSPTVCLETGLVLWRWLS